MDKHNPESGTTFKVAMITIGIIAVTMFSPVTDRIVEHRIQLAQQREKAAEETFPNHEACPDYWQNGMKPPDWMQCKMGAEHGKQP